MPSLRKTFTRTTSTRRTTPARTRYSLQRALDRNLTPSAREELLYLTLS